MLSKSLCAILLDHHLKYIFKVTKTFSELICDGMSNLVIDHRSPTRLVVLLVDFFNKQKVAMKEFAEAKKYFCVSLLVLVFLFKL